MEFYTLNLDTSRDVYDALNEYGLVHAKECYLNTFHMVDCFWEDFADYGWRIVFGYVESVQDVWVRHSFALDASGHVVDPTFYTWEDDTARRYTAFKIYSDPNEYIQAIKLNKNYPSLSYPNHPIRLDEKNHHAQLLAAGCCPIGY